MSSILKNANDIKRKTISKSDINGIVKENLLAIKRDIENAVNNIQDSIIYKLPDQFALDLPSTKPEEIRTIIYYHILQELNAKDYTPKIKRVTKEEAEKNNLEHGFFLQVSWENNYKNVELSDMREYISQFMVGNKKN